MQNINEDAHYTRFEAVYWNGDAKAREGGDCYKCGFWYPTADLTFCAAGTCENEICCDCRTTLQMELEVCCDEHGEKVVELMKRQLDELRGKPMGKPAASAPATQPMIQRMVA